MRNIEIEYNPYSGIKMKDEGKDVCIIDSYVFIHKFIKDKIPLNVWVRPNQEKNWDGLINFWLSDKEENSKFSEEINITFIGREVDYKKFIFICKEENQKRKYGQIKLNFKHEKVVDDGFLLNNFDETMEQIVSYEMVSDELKSTYLKLRENPIEFKINTGKKYDIGILYALIFADFDFIRKEIYLSKQCTIKNANLNYGQINIRTLDNKNNILNDSICTSSESLEQILIDCCEKDNIDSIEILVDFAKSPLLHNISKSFPVKINIIPNLDNKNFNTFTYDYLIERQSEDKCVINIIEKFKIKTLKEEILNFFDEYIFPNKYNEIVKTCAEEILKIKLQCSHGLIMGLLNPFKFHGINEKLKEIEKISVEYSKSIENLKLEIEKLENIEIKLNALILDENLIDNLRLDFLDFINSNQLLSKMKNESRPAFVQLDEATIDKCISSFEMLLEKSIVLKNKLLEIIIYYKEKFDFFVFDLKKQNGDFILSNDFIDFMSNVENININKKGILTKKDLINPLNCIFNRKTKEVEKLGPDTFNCGKLSNEIIRIISDINIAFYDFEDIFNENKKNLIVEINNQIENHKNNLDELNKNYDQSKIDYENTLKLQTAKEIINYCKMLTENIV